MVDPGLNEPRPGPTQFEAPPPLLSRAPPPQQRLAELAALEPLLELALIDPRRGAVGQKQRLWGNARCTVSRSCCGCMNEMQ